MKKRLFLFLFTLITTIMISVPISAKDAKSMTVEWYGEENAVVFLDQSIEDISETDKNEITLLLKKYAKIREKDFLKISENNNTIFTYDNDSRINKIKDYEKNANLDISNAHISWQISDGIFQKDVLNLTVREWTFVDYDDLYDNQYTIDTFGFGITRTITFQRTENGWKISSDENPVAFMEEEINENINSKETITNTNQSGTSNISISGTITPLASYNASAAVAYADKYALNYNPNYSNYNSIGGDCANFVSQCLYAGGLTMANDWYWYSYSNRSGSWTVVPNLKTAMVNRGYQAVYISSYGTSSFSSFSAGDVIMFGSGQYHTMICTGKDSAGRPYYNAHNTDQYHTPLYAPWYLSDGTAGYSYTVIKMNGSTPPSNVSLNPSSTLCAVGTTITFTPSAKDATRYAYRVIDSAGKTVAFEEYFTGSKKWTPTKADTYIAWTTASNSYGHTDSARVKITVKNKPSNIILSIDKTTCYVGDTVTLEPKGNYADSYAYRITDSNGKTVAFEEKFNGKRYWKPTVAGTYTAWCTAISTVGYADSPKTKITVNVKSKPSDIVLSIDKTTCYVGDTVTLEPKGNNADSYAYRITDSNGKTVAFEEKFNGKRYWKPTVAGTYTAWCTAISTVGYTDSPKTKITVKEKESNPTSPSAKFTDVPDNAWFASSVYDLAGQGIISGMTETTFVPDGLITRAQFAKILAAASGESNSSYTGKTSFSDVSPSAWYASYVQWAYEKGIVKGISDTSFAPEANITREQMAAMICRYAAYKGVNLPQTNNRLNFKDDASISGWAKNNVYAMQQAGIINGYTDGNGYIFKPQGNATRAEAAKMISAFLSLK